jgi:hypothetical protein
VARSYIAPTAHKPSLWAVGLCLGEGGRGCPPGDRLLPAARSATQRLAVFLVGLGAIRPIAAAERDNRTSEHFECPPSRWRKPTRAVVLRLWSRRQCSSGCPQAPPGEGCRKGASCGRLRNARVVGRRLLMTPVWLAPMARRHRVFNTLARCRRGRHGQRSREGQST